MSRVPMAVKLVTILLLWDLTFMIQDVASFCNVTCTTDYETSLNCSCSGAAPTSPILLEASCRDYIDEVNGSCEIRPPQSWCLMYPERFEEDMLSVDTTCTARVNQKASQVKVNVHESSSWILSEMVKPLPPFGVQVTNTNGVFNITWDINNHLGQCLSYTVRIRASEDSSKDAVCLLLEDQKHILIHPAKLQPYTNFKVDVQASMCPSATYRGPWSEWSSTTEWSQWRPTTEWTPRRKDDDPVEDIDARWWYLFLMVVPVLTTLLLCCLKPLWLKKLQLITYIPRPDEFFTPLYHTYEGNFKDWVRPTFTEYDVLMISSSVGLKSEQQHDVLHWNTEKESYGDEHSETKHGGGSRDSFQPHSASLLHYHEGSSPHGTGHSTGHVSIHTVTLSGGSGGERVSRSSINTLRSYQDGECFGSYAGDSGGSCGLGDSGMCREGGVSAQDGNQMSADMDCEPRGHIMEPERVSLDSFASNEQSEDGYPCVDLDTIDSGFGESDCSSPVTSESTTEGRTDSDLFSRAGNSNSNYVKQWMICSTLQEDNSSSVERLPETQ